AQMKAAEAWLANGMEDAIPEFLRRANSKTIEGSIYHLTDKIWILPAMEHYAGAISMTYFHKEPTKAKDSGDTTSDAAIQDLINHGQDKSNYTKRTHASISHDKFLV